MRLLVIGDTGVLSRAIATAAVRQGHEVTIVTDGRGPLPQPNGIRKHLIADRHDGKSLSTALATTAVDVWDLVVDAICYNDEDASILFGLIEGRTRHTIIISTAILSDPGSPLSSHSSAPPNKPDDLGPYVGGKLLMERFWLDTWSMEEHPVTILRPPHIVGIGCQLGVIVPVPVYWTSGRLNQAAFLVSA